VNAARGLGEIRRRAGIDVQRRAGAGVAASTLVLVLAAVPPSTAHHPPPSRPNVLIVLTDDQSFDTLPSDVGAPPMPWLQSQLEALGGHWVSFTNAVVNTPLCCPSRASILTGLTSSHTGVATNADGFDLNEGSTVATALHDAGYTTALIGKYLNGFPWHRGPYVPAGWDRFVAKRNQGFTTTYFDYHVIDQGVPLFVGHTPAGYATSFLADEASSFLRSAPVDRPWFLLFSPPAPHAPWIPAPQDAGAFRGTPVPMSSPRVLNDVAGKPAWVRSLPPITAEDELRLISERRLERATLLDVDRATRRLVEEVASRGELDHTVVVFMTDNGLAFGEHRWTSKRCPYEECIRTPLAVRTPWVSSGVVELPVSNVDLAPTILDLAGASDALRTDGVSLAPFLDGRGDPAPDRTGVLIEYAGDAVVPPWRGVRTQAFMYVENLDGTVELYDLAGAHGPPDPRELRNRSADPRYAGTVQRLREVLAALLRGDD
jgi:N-acetylglucosamine-6-sulfatase